MIKSFADADTEAIFRGKAPRRVPADIRDRAWKKLFLIDTVTRLLDLRVPPGNKLEALSGGRAGQHSIRVNQQWRICFVWRDGDAHEVEFCDYH